MVKKVAISLAIAVLLGGAAFAASKIYRYRCPKCSLIQEYQTPGVKKCPNDGRTMIQVN